MKNKVINLDEYRKKRKNCFTFLLNIPAGVEIFEVVPTAAGVVVATSDGTYMVAWDGSGATKIDTY